MPSQGRLTRQRSPADIISLLALQVTADYACKIRNNEIGVEDIQDSVEATLQRAGYAAVAKS